MLGVRHSYAYMKFHSKKHGNKSLTLEKIQRFLIFGAIFGLVMLMIGLSQLFAQSTLAFYLNPYYQSANANEDRSLTVTLSNSGQQVDGGSVKITYNPAQLAYVAFSDPASTQVGITNRVNSPGSYSYDFQVYNGSQTLPNLGVIVLKAKTFSSQQTAFIDFDSSATRAYFVSNNSRNYYPAAHGRAAIIINASASSAPPPAQTPTQTSAPPATTTSPTVTSQPPGVSRPPVQNNTASNSPTSATSPVHVSQGLSPRYPGPDGLYYLQPADSNSQSAGYIPPPKPKKIAPIVFMVIGVVCLAAAGGLYIYMKYIRDMPIAIGFGRSLHNNIFDEVPNENSDETIVITPAANSADNEQQSEEDELKPDVKVHPAIIKKSKERAMHRHASADSKKKQPPKHEDKSDANAPAASKQPHEASPPEHHASHKPEHHHEESETVTVSLHPHPGEAAAASTRSSFTPPPSVSGPQVQPKSIPQPKLVVPSAPAKHQAKVIAPPPAPPPFMPVSPSLVQPAKESKIAKGPYPGTDQSHHVPDWQAQLKVPSTKPEEDDDPPDMFELAHDHPNSFGSAQLYEEETHEKEDHDKTQK